MGKSIPRRYVDNYAEVIDALSQKAQAEAAAAIAKVNLANTDAAREALLDVMQALCGAYSNSAASVAARFYEICRNYVLGGEYEALTDSGRAPDATRIAVLGIFKHYTETGNAESLATQLLDRVDYEIEMAARRCTFANMEADPYRR